MSAERRLVLFDIDGTLLSASAVFRRAVAEALEATFGLAPPMDGYDFSGKTDPQIVRELMREGGLGEEAIARGLGDALGSYQERLLALMRPGDIRPKPGVHALLGALAAEARVTLGLLTGNLEPCARAKLEPLGVNACFPFGAYGSDHEDRHRLPALAVERAYRLTGHRFVGKSIVIVGDSIHDVRCGHDVGARAVAVATGRTSKERLAAEQPDALFEDLTDTAAVVRAVLD